MHNPDKDKVVSVEIMTEMGRVFGVVRRKLPNRLKEEFDDLMKEVVDFRNKIPPRQIQNKF